MSEAAKTGKIVRFEPDGFGVVEFDQNQFGWFANNDVAPGVRISRTSVGSTVAFDLPRTLQENPHLTDVRIIQQK